MRYPFLALLAHQPRHGYDLKLALEQLFGDALPPMNAGQVYTTLARLERDGLVQGARVAEDPREKRVYELTDAGRAALAGWLAEPAPGPQLKDEFFMKLVLSRLPGVDGDREPAELIARQRRAYLQSLRELNDLAIRLGNGSNQAAALLVEGAILHLQADLKWLDLCEEQMTEGASQWNRS
jgi:DNA-binding PadR family transcriptional regulator